MQFGIDRMEGGKMNFLFWEIKLCKPDWKMKAKEGRKLAAIQSLYKTKYGTQPECKDKVIKYMKAKNIKFENQEKLQAYLLGLVDTKYYDNPGLYMVNIKSDGTHSITKMFGT